MDARGACIGGRAISGFDTLGLVEFYALERGIAYERMSDGGHESGFV